MSFPRRVRNAAAFASLLLFSGCSDAVAPVVTKVRALAARVDNLLTCTNSWTTANSGNWETGANWSLGHAPTATEDACIVLEGNYTVYTYGFATAKSLTISAPGNVTKPTLQVYGYTNGPGWPPTDSYLYITNNIDNYGFIIMTSAGLPNPGATTIRITGTGTWYNHAGSAFYTRQGTGPGRIVNAAIVNDGDAGFDESTVFTGSFVNNGHFVTGPAASVEMHFVDFTQNSDRFENNGSLVSNQGGFTINGGVMSGNDPYLMYSHLTIGDPNVATSLYLRGVTTLDGNVGANQVLNVNGLMQPGWPPFDAELKWTSGLQNAGVIRMQSLGTPGEASVKLTVPNNGTIVNTGRIETIGAVANARIIAANIDNRPEGTVDLKAYTILLGAGGTSTNAGTWKLENTMYISGPLTFAQSGGTLDATGGWQQVWGSSTFEMGGGTIIGTPWLSGATVRIPATSNATGSLLFTGEVTLVGDVKTGQTLTVAGYQPGPGWPPVNGQITMNGNVTNHGKIVMTSIGDNPGSTILKSNAGATLTNATDGRVDILTGTGAASRQIFGNFTNDGTLHNEVLTLFSTGIVHSSGHVDGGGELRMWYGTTSFFSGAMQANILNAGTMHIGQAVGAPGTLAVDGWVYFYDGNLNVDIGGTVPGTDFDRMTATGGATLGATLNVAAVGGKCAGGGQSYEVISAPPRAGDFGAKNGLNLGGGRTVTTVLGPNNYVLNVSGPPCVPPDVSAPIIAPSIASGTLGNNGWYTSDVTVTWSVTDAESAVTAQNGCGATTVSQDTDGVTFTCTATSAGGTATQSVTIKRDATPPVVSASRLPAANANGWNNTDVSASWTASDAMSGVAGSATASDVYSTEGANQGGSHTFTDRAGNTASASVSGISIDKTAPVVSASRLPAANANGWNNTDVTATWTATDALSGLAASGTATDVYSAEGANQGGSHTFTDRAGNSASASVSGINIDKTAPVVQASRLPAANANGWNNTDVTATWTATDALSGLSGAGTDSQLFSDECQNNSASRTFTDLAGNSASAGVSGINIDKTAPVVTVTRSPAPGADGWNETNVTATYSATDALSGIAGASTFTQLFGLGANQSGSHTFADKAGNSATGTISGINVRTPPPPPPPTGGNSIGSASPGEIWPPNNKMVAVKVTMCVGVASYTLRSVTNNETGTADVEGWAIGTADLNGSVRATRNGDGNGRTYTLVYDTIGSSGAAGTCTVTVVVPHDQGGKK